MFTVHPTTPCGTTETWQRACSLSPSSARPRRGEEVRPADASWPPRPQHGDTQTSRDPDTRRHPGQVPGPWQPARKTQFSAPLRPPLWTGVPRSPHQTRYDASPTVGTGHLPRADDMPLDLQNPRATENHATVPCATVGKAQTQVLLPTAPPASPGASAQSLNCSAPQACCSSPWVCVCTCCLLSVEGRSTRPLLRAELITVLLSGDRTCLS